MRNEASTSLAKPVFSVTVFFNEHQCLDNPKHEGKSPFGGCRAQGIPMTTVSRARAYPPELKEAENQRLKVRRTAAGIPDSTPGESLPRVGLALSGGGIRSATFSLGVLQALAKLNLIRRIDYLSTVSGGGYIGSFFGSLFARGKTDVAEVTKTLRPDRAQESDEIGWLRRNGRYLAPNGGDVLVAAASGLRGWLALMVVISVSLCCLLLGVELGIEKWNTQFANLSIDKLPQLEGWWWSSLLGLALPLLLVFCIPMGWAYWAVEKFKQGLGHPLFGIGLTALALGSNYLGLMEAQAQLMFWILNISVLTFLWLILALDIRYEAPGILFCLGIYWILPENLLEAVLPITSLPLYPDTENRGTLGCLLAILAIALLLWRFWRLSRGKQPQVRGPALARRRLTNWLAFTLYATGVIVLIGLIESAGIFLYGYYHLEDGTQLVITGAITAALVLAAQRISSIRGLLTLFMGQGKLSLPSGVLIWVVAVALAAGLFSLVSTAAQALLWNFSDPFINAKALNRDLQLQTLTFTVLEPAALYWLLLLAYTLLFARAWTFVNRSSHHALYNARLTRSYLGASNPARIDPNKGVPVTDTHPDDDIPMDRYWRAEAQQHGAPLHLVNVTINETVSDISGTLNRDRKGIPLAVGPCALSAGIRHHYLLPVLKDQKPQRPSTLSDKDYWMFEDHETQGVTGWRKLLWQQARALIGPVLGVQSRQESLSLGQWVAISGAAFTTGTGYQTSLATSLLTGLTNVRLGYWWRSGSTPPAPREAGGYVARFFRHIFRVQSHLMDELAANFRGPGEPYWYLSDGGHFENMGAYELVRRQLPVIVIVDGEADPDYTYEGLASLVRKVRMDFGAEIEFLDAQALNGQIADPKLREVFGTLSDLKPDEHGHSRAHAALARITYHDSDQPPSVLIYLKPTIKPDAPADVREYQQRNAPFPQQTTLDQFFDESQWESYRRLGQFVGEAVFTAPKSGGWRPGDLKPL